MFQKEQQQRKAMEESEDATKAITFKTKIGRNIHRILFETKLPKINELFLPNRMAYIVDLGDDESDVPVTSIRSKAECPNSEALITLTTNDIVINKLTQILSYLRQSKRDNKKNKQTKREEVKQPEEDESGSKLEKKLDDFNIYDDIGDYVPDVSSKKGQQKSSGESSDIKRKNYFIEDKDKVRFEIFFCC